MATSASTQLLNSDDIQSSSVLLFLTQLLNSDDIQSRSMLLYVHRNHKASLWT